MTDTMKTTHRALPLLLALAAAACDNPAGEGNGGYTPPQPKPLAALEVTPGEATILEGYMTQLEVAFRAADGTGLAARPVAWSSSDTTVAVVSESGTVRARAAGEATITASAEGKEARAEIEVEALRAARLTLSHQQLHLAFGQTAQVGATAAAQDGSWFPAQVTWTTSTPEVATVDAQGRITGTGYGSASVKARVGDVVAEVYVTSQAPVLPGAWVLSVEGLEGGGTVCTVENAHLNLLLDGAWIAGGTQAWSDPRVSCAVAGGEPPYTTPFAPSGAATGWIAGKALSLRLNQSGWILNGEFTAAGRIEGTATYREDVDGGLRVRTGRFVLRRL